MAKTFNLQKIVKISATIVLIVIIFLIAFYYIFKTNRSSNLFFEKVKEPEKPRLHEGVVHFEIQGEQRRLTVRADRHFLGEDNKYHLEGNVEVRIFPKNKDQKEIIIFAENGKYNEKRTLFELSSGVRITQGDLVLKSEFIIYKKLKNILRAKGKISFFSNKVIGTGRGLLYLLDEEEISIIAKIRGKIMENVEAYPIYFQCNKLKYNRKEKKGELMGNVLIRKKNESLRSKYASFKLDEFEKKLRSIFLRDNANVILINEKADLEEPIEIRKLQANEILISFSEEGNRISSIQGEGNCFFEISSSRSADKEMSANKIKLFLDDSKEALKLYASGEVWFKDIEKEREMRGSIVSRNEELLSVLGEKGKERAFISFKNNNLYAEKITVSLKDESIKAERGVENTIYPDNSKQDDLTFLSPGEPFKISAKSMDYNTKEERAVFRENVSLRQGSNLILSQEIIVDSSKKILTAKGGVKTFLRYDNSEEKVELIKIYSDAMELNHSERVIVFKGNNSLFLKDLNINADKIGIYLKKEKGEIEKIEAQDKIKVEWNRFEASGNRAEYIMREEKLILYENVILKDNQKSREVKGTKLTFYLPSDRILMENKEGRIAASLEIQRK